MPVIDDPISMIRCTNKIYLHELMTANGIAVPPTVIIGGQHDLARAADELGFPMVLKVPDSSFSRGVKKVDSPAELDALAKEWLKDTDLLLAQAFMPTNFDWRVGVLGGKPLFVCQYLMAKKHWQIVKHRSQRQAARGRRQHHGARRGAAGGHRHRPPRRPAHRRRPLRRRHQGDRRTASSSSRSTTTPTSSTASRTPPRRTRSGSS